MAITLIKPRLGTQLVAEVTWVSATPKPTSLRGFLMNISSFTGLNDQTTLATWLGYELAEANGYSRFDLLSPAAGSSAFDATNNKWQIAIARTLNASGATLTYNAIGVIWNGSASANKIVTSLDTGTDTLTVTSHGLTDGTPVVLTVDSGGTFPANGQSVTGTTLVYADSTGTNTFQLHTNSGLTNLVNFSSAGSGTLRIRYAAGVPIILSLDTNSTSVASGQSTTINFNPATA